MSTCATTPVPLTPTGSGHTALAQSLCDTGGGEGRLLAGASARLRSNRLWPHGITFASAVGSRTCGGDVQTRIVQVRQQILKKNDTLARDLRRRFNEAGVYVVSMVSSPGAGKTTFLRETLCRLVRGWNVAALVGDLATENDARKLAESGAPVRQIVTGTVCHLEAEMVETAITSAGWDLKELDFLFLENVGNLVCPSSFDLGEHLRLVLLSTTEGEDKPLKYPTIFNTADVAVITKSDLADAAHFDRQEAMRNIHEVRPGMPVLEVSARTGGGMNEWFALLARACRTAGIAAMPDPVLQHTLAAPSLPPLTAC
jgi:hydrogenase nickel incorporation protein HypB